MKLKLALMALCALICAPSCSQRIADLTVASTKNMDLNNSKGYSASYNARSKGEDVSHIVLFIPTGTPNIKEAIDKAIERNGNNCVGLSNVTLTQKWFYIPLVYGQVKYVAEGDPIYIK